MPLKLAHLLLGADPRLRRLLYYWAGSGLFYLVCIGVLQLQVHAIEVPGIGGPVTFSARLVQRIGEEPFSDSITRAERAMYQARASGRYKVVAG